MYESYLSISNIQEMLINYKNAQDLDNREGQDNGILHHEQRSLENLNQEAAVGRQKETRRRRSTWKRKGQETTREDTTGNIEGMGTKENTGEEQEGQGKQNICREKSHSHLSRRKRPEPEGN